MEEVTYYSDGTVWVTNQRVILGDKTYPLASIRSVKIDEEFSKDSGPGVKWIVLIVVAFVVAFLASLISTPLKDRLADYLVIALDVVAPLALGLAVSGIFLYDLAERLMAGRPKWEVALDIVILLLYIGYIVLKLTNEDLSETLELPLYLSIYAIFFFLTSARKFGYTYTVMVNGPLAEVAAFTSENRGYVQRIVNTIRYALLKQPT